MAEQKNIKFPNTQSSLHVLAMVTGKSLHKSTLTFPPPPLPDIRLFTVIITMMTDDE